MTDAHGNTPTPTRQRARLPRAPAAPSARSADARASRSCASFSILVGLSLLAFVSTVFGMMMAVASDLPELENREQYRSSKNNSVLLDYRGRQLGILTTTRTSCSSGSTRSRPR